MALYSIGYYSDDFLSGAKGKSGDPAFLAPKDDLDTTQEWEITDLPGSGFNNKRLVIIRNIKSQNYLALKKQRGAPALPNDEVILDSDGQQIWELNEADEQGQYFIKLPQQDGNCGVQGVPRRRDFGWVSPCRTPSLSNSQLFHDAGSERRVRSEEILCGSRLRFFGHRSQEKKASR